MAASPAPRADVARVLPSGDVVVAGRAEPGAAVTLLDNGKPLMDLRADPKTGEFVFLPPRLPPGAHNLTLRGPAESGNAPESAVMAFTVAPPAVKSAHAAQQAAPAPAEPAALQPHEHIESSIPKGNMATIARGDTLWRLSRDRLGRGALYPSIFQANSDKIRNPDLIYPGQALTIP